MRLACAACVLVGTLLIPPEGSPTLSFEPGVPADVERLTSSTWGRFTAAFAARNDCVEGVAVATAWKLDDRALYSPGRRLVTLRIPGTATNLRATLVHEFAHHLEYTCPEAGSLRRRFLAAMGRPAGSGWRSGRSWSETPSEMWAEAVTEYVLGPRTAHDPTMVTPRTLRVVRSWARAR